MARGCRSRLPALRDNPAHPALAWVVGKGKSEKHKEKSKPVVLLRNAFLRGWVAGLFVERQTSSEKRARGLETARTRLSDQGRVRPSGCAR